VALKTGHSRFEAIQSRLDPLESRVHLLKVASRRSRKLLKILKDLIEPHGLLIEPLR
jgi:hypothetical protein